jgi:hypothetical protein
MRLPNIQKILRQDVAEAPDWVLKIIGPINGFFEEIYVGLNRNITLRENIACNIVDVQFDTSASYPSVFTSITIPSKLRTVAEGVLILKISEKAENLTLITTATSLQWSAVEGGVRIDLVAGLAVSKTYNMRVMIV